MFMMYVHYIHTIHIICGWIIDATSWLLSQRVYSTHHVHLNQVSKPCISVEIFHAKSSMLVRD